MLENTRVSVAAATAIVGYDLLQGVRDARTPEARVLAGIGLVGSAAAGDAIIEIYVNRQLVGTYSNTSTGSTIDRQKDLLAMDTFVPGNAQIEAKVIDAPGTNPLVLHLEYSAPKSSGRRFTGRRRSYGGGTRRAAPARRSFRPSGGMY